MNEKFPKNKLLNEFEKERAQQQDEFEALVAEREKLGIQVTAAIERLTKNRQSSMDAIVQFTEEKKVLEQKMQTEQDPYVRNFQHQLIGSMDFVIGEHKKIVQGIHVMFEEYLRRARVPDTKN